MQLGQTKVFLRAGQMAELDAKRAEMLSNAAKKIQRQVRTFLARRHLIAMRKAAVTIQKYWRGMNLVFNTVITFIGILWIINVLVLWAHFVWISWFHPQQEGLRASDIRRCVKRLQQFASRRMSVCGLPGRSILRQKKLPSKSSLDTEVWLHARSTASDVRQRLSSLCRWVSNIHWKVWPLF